MTNQIHPRSEQPDPASIPQVTARTIVGTLLASSPLGLIDVGLPVESDSPSRSFSGRPSATVAVCTHNRVHDATLCIRALVPQAEQAGLSVVLIDSGSDCANAAELRQLAAAHGIDHLRLDTAGLSLARNAAHQHASSDWIVYLDDDAVPESGWAKSLLLALSNAPAEVAIVGGKVTPTWPVGSDHTRITSRWKLLLSCVDPPGVGLVSEGYDICGANFAVRRSALERAGRFPTKLGRDGKCLIGGEESYLIDRMSSLGLLSIYNDVFAVQHRIPPERLAIKWVARRAFWEGVTRARIVKELGEPIPAHLRRGKLLVSLPVLFLLHLFSGDPDYTIRYNMALGSLLAQSRLLH